MPWIAYMDTPQEQVVKKKDRRNVGALTGNTYFCRDGRLYEHIGIYDRHLDGLLCRLLPAYPVLA
jgi:hypothetical protein